MVEGDDAPAPVEARGEMRIELEGRSYVLRPSFEAIGAIETGCKRSLIELARAAETGALRSDELAEIVAQCIRAEGRAANDPMLRSVNARRVGEMLFAEEGGLLWATREVVTRLLFRAVTGGYTALGEPKGAGMASTTPAPGSGS